MQKLLSSVNQAPDWRAHGDFVEAGDNAFQSSLAKAKKSMKHLLVSLINARVCQKSFKKCALVDSVLVVSERNCVLGCCPVEFSSLR
jgi:hypothetical protein